MQYTVEITRKPS